MKTARILLSLALLAAPVAPLKAAPISFNTALPVHQGGLLFRGPGVWMRLHDDPSPMGRAMDVAMVPSVLVYGATAKLALMGVFPYLDKRLAVKSTGVRFSDQADQHLGACRPPSRTMPTTPSEQSTTG